MQKYTIETLVGIFLVFRTALYRIYDLETRPCFPSWRQLILSLRPIHLGDRSESRSPVYMLGIEVGRVETTQDGPGKPEGLGGSSSTKWR